MSEEHIWALHDMIIIVVGIALVVGIIVIDFIFCGIFHGFCAVRYFFTLVGTGIMNGIPNTPSGLFAKGIVWGVLRMVDLIPI